MKLSGHSDHSGQDDSIVLAALAEITLGATPEESRAMAAFLVDCASAMDRWVLRATTSTSQIE